MDTWTCVADISTPGDGPSLSGFAASQANNATQPIHPPHPRLIPQCVLPTLYPTYLGVRLSIIHEAEKWNHTYSHSSASTLSLNPTPANLSLGSVITDA